MGLKCPKCGTDNLITAIFCRGCGDKLDLDAMTPEVIIADKKKGMPLGQKIGVAVFFGIVVLIALAFICPVGKLKGDKSAIPEQIKTAFETLRNGPVQPSKKKKKKEELPVPTALSFSFSSQEATNLMNMVMNTPKELNDNTKMTNVSIQFQEGNVIRVVVSTKVFNAIPVDNVVKVKYSVSGPGSVDGQVISRKLGLVPAFGIFAQIVNDNTKSVYNYTSDLRSHAKASTCSNNKVTIEL